MAERAHAVLGASSSHRWIECPGSIKLSAGLPNSESSYAREGSAAHAVAEFCLDNNVDAATQIGEEIKGYADIECTEEMADAVQVYLDTVRAEHDTRDLNSELGVEVKFDLQHIYGGMFGTNDATVYNCETKKLTVFDYKHGQGLAVDVKENPQLMYYAVGALTGKHNRPIDEIELVIVQPRCPHKDGPVRRWTTTPDVLLDFIHELIEAAERTEKDNAPFKAGDWCKFCPAAGICNTLYKFVCDEAMAEFGIDGELMLDEPEKFTPEQLARLKTHAAILKGWFASVEQFAHAQALAGVAIPGFMLANGRNSRGWRSEGLAREGLRDMGFTDKEIFQPPKMRTVAQMEAFYKGKTKKDLEDLWITKPGGVSLVSIHAGKEPLRPTADEEF